ncbi:hypothetical protein [Kibdelosporangium persicum]
MAQTNPAAPPTIIAGPDAIAHRTVGTRDRCRPVTRVKVGVIAPDGVRSVRMTVQIRDAKETVSMIGMAGNWYSHVGPFRHRYAGHVAEVTVLAVAGNGQTATKSLGQIQVVRC